MIRLLALSLLVMAAMSSCKKMALRHTCICDLSRTIDGQEETTGSISDQQIGTYNTASDSCKAMQERYTYTTTSNGYTEVFSATCEIE